MSERNKRPFTAPLLTASMLHYASTAAMRSYRSLQSPVILLSEMLRTTLTCPFRLLVMPNLRNLIADAHKPLSFGFNLAECMGEYLLNSHQEGTLLVASSPFTDLCFWVVDCSSASRTNLNVTRVPSSQLPCLTVKIAGPLRNTSVLF